MSKPYVNYQSVSPDALHNLLKIHGPTFQKFTKSTIEFEKLSLQGIWIPKKYQDRALEATKVTFVEVDGNLVMTSYPLHNHHSTFMAAKFKIEEDFELNGDGEVPESGVIEFWGAGEDTLADLYEGNLNGYKDHYWVEFKDIAEFVEKYSELKLLASRPEVDTVVLSYMFTEEPGWIAGIQGDFYHDGEWYEFAALGNMTTTLEQRLWHFFEGNGGIPFNVMMDSESFETEDADRICEQMSENGEREFTYRNLKPIKFHVKSGTVRSGVFTLDQREYYDIETQDRNFEFENTEK